MHHLPIFVRLARQSCLVVGGGPVAERKVALLRRAGALVTVVAPGINDGLLRLAASGEIAHIPETFQATLLAGSRLVVAASDDREANRAVASAAADANVLCNVVDDNEASTFILPAIVDRSPVTIAIGTGGNAPVLAQQLKTRIEAWLPARIGTLAARAGRWRKIVARRFASMDERRRFWQRFFDGPIAEHVLANREREAERLVRRELLDGARHDANAAGEAWIVGAGPGDPGLVTIRAQQLISRAEVILYDRLVSKPVLDFARKEAEVIPVGKQCGRAVMSQDEINALLVERVRRGQRVCRLKGGDPFVFGRGGEEAQALAAAGLPYQVVPGISAALGCAAYAGIPLTMRGMSGSVTLATAKLDANLVPNWALLARAGQTLALYMGAGSIGETAARLQENGMDGNTPVAVVQHGTTSRQRVLHSTLAAIGVDAQREGVDAPAMVFIGRTAALGKKLQWFGGNEDAASTFAVDDFHALPVPQAL
jgi:uroporphyrin-III C-methyltransferase / precorrin-2 dehydrogenase / sirohydrochlorin ferrochelatase